MTTYPRPDECKEQLIRSGWSVNENGSARSWAIIGKHGERSFLASAATRADAWHWACVRAKAMGLLRSKEE